MKTWYPEADLVIKHPKIYTVAITCDEVKEGKTDFPVIEDGGVAAKDGKIIAVGQAADMDRYVGEHTEVVDASGRILTPGFVECHMHCKWTGENMLNLDFNGVTSRQAIIDALKEKVANTPAGEWIEGDGWNELIWEDSTELDQAPRASMKSPRTIRSSCCTCPPTPWPRTRAPSKRWATRRTRRSPRAPRSAITTTANWTACCTRTARSCLCSP